MTISSLSSTSTTPPPTQTIDSYFGCRVIKPSEPTPFQAEVLQAWEEIKKDHEIIKNFIICTVTYHQNLVRVVNIMDHSYDYHNDRPVTNTHRKEVWYLNDITDYQHWNTIALTESARRVNSLLSFKFASFDETVQALEVLKSRGAVHKAVNTLVGIIPLVIINIITEYCHEEAETLTLTYRKDIYYNAAERAEIVRHRIVWGEETAYRNHSFGEVQTSLTRPGSIIRRDELISDNTHCHIRRALPSPKEEELVTALSRRKPAETLLSEGIAKEKLGAKEEAEVLFTQALEILGDGATPEVLDTVISLKMKLGKFQDVETLMSQKLRIRGFRPSDVDFANFGFIKIKLSKYGEADLFLEKAWELSKAGPNPNLLLSIGMNKFKLKSYERAEFFFEQLLKLPKVFAPWLAKGYAGAVKLKLGKEAEAHSLFREASQAFLENKKSIPEDLLPFLASRS